ncbi:MAG: HAD family hydrolase [Acidobacteriota bacterium]|nr:HAD family hydrolase [Blastocatellia bacterium]MDW8411742.1 HAD family hydrolase [Acidobacteriota bacterium]
MSHIAVFMDRDGTISEEVGYVNHPSRYKLFPTTAAAIKRINEAGLKAIIVTNQAGVARGYFSEELVLEIHQMLIRDLASVGARLDAIYYCPHHPTIGQPPYRVDCNCRKPKPGMLERAAIEHDIDLARSFMIGDRISDIELIKHVGGRGIMVMTGYGLGEYEYQRHNWKVMPDKVVPDLPAAVDWIINTLV